MIVPLCAVHRLVEDVEIFRQHGHHVLGRILLADRGEVVDVGEERRHFLPGCVRPENSPDSMPLRTSSFGT